MNYSREYSKFNMVIEIWYAMVEILYAMVEMFDCRFGLAALKRNGSA
jgi:hypothetical protein